MSWNIFYSLNPFGMKKLLKEPRTKIKTHNYRKSGILRNTKETNKGTDFFRCVTASRTALGPTQHPIQWVPGALSLSVKRPGREADHSPPSSTEVKNAWSYTLTPPIRSEKDVPAILTEHSPSIGSHNSHIRVSCLFAKSWLNSIVGEANLVQWKFRIQVLFNQTVTESKQRRFTELLFGCTSGK
jgi:hypothetical protein